MRRRIYGSFEGAFPVQSIPEASCTRCHAVCVSERNGHQRNQLLLPCTFKLLLGTSRRSLTAESAFLDRFQVDWCHWNQYLPFHNRYLRYHQVPGRHRLAHLARGPIRSSNNAVRRKYRWSPFNVRHWSLYRHRSAYRSWKRFGQAQLGRNRCHVLLLPLDGLLQSHLERNSKLPMLDSRLAI